MFATLPDFTPRDSHSLWYTSSRAPLLGGLPDGPRGSDMAHNNHHQGSNGHHQRQRGHILERTALARLAADEAYMQRRRTNAQNFGSTWLKPPGLPKTLHQMREEKREQEEHQEAMRREQLAQELAEAEAEAAAEGEDAMDDVQLDGAQDLDEDIPDADDEFALGGGSDSEEEEEEEEEADGHMLDEEDFVPSSLLDDGGDGDVDLGMDANLDDDIPEAGDEYEAGYEHTDSDAALSSDDQRGREESSEEEDIGFAPRAAPLVPPQSPTLRGHRPRRSNAGASTAGPRSSMDLSAFLSQDESSFMDSSPVQGRRNMRG
ncbi:hypothetical protein LLEC1_00162 [Akanthomyces lecanii]|uniref:Anaphase-promoting complex, subunit 15/MND2 n=1 Tax=Cordyceps confragosa TaxID=2714763 RepID=A0A179IH56_CORDF|nr:hypothetical protein LLEC1_00162 [Akanthomyces lecanii]